jgi:predicted Zn-dependent protease
MQSSGPIDIVQVLLLFDEKNSTEYGLALWAALNEAEAFYNTGATPRMKVQRFYISPSIPSAGIIDTITRSVSKLFVSTTYALDVLSQDERVQAQVADADSMRSSNAKTYDQTKLIERARDNLLVKPLSNQAATIPLMIVTDRPITPPEDWRYIIWETWPSPANNAVISAAPLDPKYWGDPDTNRIAVLKDRVRTAAISVCGEFLGLHSCRNPRCFLFDTVDSVTNLDQMSRLGQEHRSEVEDLVGLGFDRIVSDPNIIQATKQVSHSGGKA